MKSYRLLILVVLCISACPMNSVVWLLNTESLATLAFGISTRRGGTEPVFVSGLRVGKCDAPDIGTNGAMWIVHRTDSAALYPTVVRYGSPPAGYTTAVGPDSLIPGCYKVAISGTGRTRFVVDSTGGIREVER